MAGENKLRVLLLAGGASAVVFLAWYLFDPFGGQRPRTVEEVRAELAKSDVPPEVRAEAAAQLGARCDRSSMPQLIQALDDDDLNVRARAGAAVVKILGADYYFRADDPPERRRQAVARIERHWKAWLAKEPLP